MCQWTTFLLQDCVTTPALSTAQSVQKGKQVTCIFLYFMKRLDLQVLSLTKSRHLKKMECSHMSHCYSVILKHESSRHQHNVHFLFLFVSYKTYFRPRQRRRKVTCNITLPKDGLHLSLVVAATIKNYSCKSLQRQLDFSAATTGGSFVATKSTLQRQNCPSLLEWYNSKTNCD